MEVDMELGWEEHVYLASDAFLEDDLGSRIVADAKMLCPVETGELRDSINAHVDGHELVVEASGSQTRDYAAYVELGHHVVAWGHPTGKFQPPRPFLRPALYQQRLP